jgi:hypothetical protein
MLSGNEAEGPFWPYLTAHKTINRYADLLYLIVKNPLSDRASNPHSKASHKPTKAL